MFSRKMWMVVVVLVCVAANIVFLHFAGKEKAAAFLPNRILLTLVAPFQEGATKVIRFSQHLWRQYFYHVNLYEQNQRLKRELALANAKQNRLRELELSNQRLRRLLQLKKSVPQKIVAAEVVGRDTSQWFRTIVINKGAEDGVEKGYAIVAPEGVVGQVVETAPFHAKVLLIVDANSAVAVKVQRTRARGILKGDPSGLCRLDYALRKHDIKTGDIIITTGQDRVFPKGLLVGRVTAIDQPHAGIFKNVLVHPFIDFTTIEEVMVIIEPPLDSLRGNP
jgi:rod shape-determining protein MreC